MPTTYTFTANSPIVSGSKAFNTANDQDFRDLLDWAKVAYAGLANELFNTSSPPNPNFVPTDGQIATALATGTMRAWVQASQKYKKDNSVAAVPDPPPTGWA